MLALGVVFPVLVAVSWLKFAGGRWGWLPTLLAFSLVGFVTGQLAVSTQWARARASASIGLALLAGIAGVTVAHHAPANPARLRHEIEEVAQPGWRLEKDAEDGSPLCLDYCPSVSREYLVPSGMDEVIDGLGPVLVSRGLEPTTALDQGRVEFAERRGDIEMRVAIVSESGESTRVFITVTTR